MNKTELISAIAKEGGFKKGDVEKMTDILFSTIMNEVADGNKVQVIGFGSFERKDRAERIVTNPKTQEPITVAASKVPSFSAGSVFKDKVNQYFNEQAAVLCRRLLFYI